MTSFRQVQGQRVVSNDDAQQIGKIAHLVVDPRTQRVTDIAVDGGKQLLPWTDVAAFGADAVMVSTGAGLHPPTDDQAKHDLLGRLILSESGNDCGPVHDIEFNPDTGQLLVVHTEHSHIDADRLLAVGHYAVVVTTQPDTEVSGR